MNTSQSVEQEERILRWPQVHERTGICRSYAHKLIAKGEFPAPVKIGPRASGWLQSSINAWIESRKAS